MREVFTLPVVALTHTNEECLLCCGLSHKITEQLLPDLSSSSKQLRISAEACGGGAGGPVSKLLSLQCAVATSLQIWPVSKLAGKSSSNQRSCLTNCSNMMSCEHHTQEPSWKETAIPSVDSRDSPISQAYEAT